MTMLIQGVSTMSLPLAIPAQRGICPPKARMHFPSVILSGVGAHVRTQQKLKRALSRPFLIQPAVKKERVSPQYEEKGYTKHDITRLPLR
jgi:hypothetical protein